MFKRLVVFISICLNPNLANAYSISTHVMLTKRAAEEYEICRRSNGLSVLPPAAVELLSLANAYEDIAFWVKALNWHFYNSSKNLGSGTFGFGHGSLLWRFQTLEKQVREVHSLSALGGLLHYVQDVTNPAHVAPVFHWFEDSFDNYDFDHVLPDIISDSECRKLWVQRDQYKTYIELLDSVSLETLTRMDEYFNLFDNELPRAIRWKTAFWNSEFGSESKQSGFGHYGVFGNNFGTAKVKSAMISSSVYSDFAKQQMRSALNASIRFIEIYQASVALR